MWAQSWSEASDRLAARPRLVFVLSPRKDPPDRRAKPTGQTARMATAPAGTPGTRGAGVASLVGDVSEPPEPAQTACDERPLDWIRRVRQGGFHAPVVLLGPPGECPPRSDEFEGLGAFSVMTLEADRAAPAAAAKEAHTRSARPAPQGRGERVLVLSQRRSLWQFARCVLERACYEVLCTRSRDTLMESLARDGADLLLIDTAMGPGSAAAETSRRIRGEARWASLPIVWSAPVGASDLEQMAAAAGADQLLREPVAGRDLLDAVSCLVGKDG